MEFEPGWAILAGIVGGVVMAAILYMANYLLPNQMKMNLFMMLGTMMLPVGTAAFVMGSMVHLVNSVFFGLIHGALYAAIDVTPRNSPFKFNRCSSVMGLVILGIFETEA